FNSVIYTATTSDGKTTNTKVDDATYDSATLLTLAHVDSWSSMELPTMKPPSLENAIELAAVLKGVDTETPFPFFISGNTNYFHIHVINGFCPVANPDLETQYLPWKLESSNTQEITVVGFYAKGQEGVMTHHGSPIHIHGIMTLNGELTTGHLDSVALNEGATIFLPSN
ncbi:MAG: hypothetical protein QF535_14005, partial [Anaerolineales bacterium]|nr:hypothetical protein [Anaerolineales bacterium]